MNISAELNSIKQFLPSIIEQSKAYRLDSKILVSIAILENINRPGWIRILEKLFSKFIKINTYGLMQVSSNKYLNDEKSIEIAAKKISKLNFKNNFLKLGKLYNGNKEYGKCLNFIFNELNELNINF